MTPYELRFPAHAGTFYAGTRERLLRQIRWCFTHDLGPGEAPTVSKAPMGNIVSAIVPHAGYVYSGPVAAHAYAALARDGVPDVVVAMGPNHTGVGSAVALMAEGAWRTPLGDVEVDKEVALRISRRSPIIDIDATAHAYEHSIEVQLPFLQFIYGSAFRLVPICLMMQDLRTAREVGEAVSSALSGMNAIVLATTDLTHYEPQRMAEQKDRLVTEAISRLDEASLQRVVESRRVSMCGLGPTSAAIVASKGLGAKRAELLCYKTSGDVTGDYTAVVGYSSFKMVK